MWTAIMTDAGLRVEVLEQPMRRELDLLVPPLSGAEVDGDDS
jgi:hypothetical protein